MNINKYKPSFRLDKQHLTKLSGYSSEEIFEILYATKVMKAKFLSKEKTNILEGVTIALLFGESSIRTRSALSIGVKQLGGDLIDLPYKKQDLLAGENFQDIVNVLARYGVGALITRDIDQKTLDEEVKSVSQIPVINAFNHGNVPLQTLCDLFTIWERRNTLEKLKIAYVGKGTETATSLLMGAIKCGMEVAVATPNEYPIEQTFLDDARQYGNIFVTDHPLEAVRKADIIYTDSYGYHALPSQQEKELLAPYQVNSSLLAAANFDCLVMHPLPAVRGLEISKDMADGKRSLIMQQAENKLHVIKAVLALLIK